MFVPTCPLLGNFLEKRYQNFKKYKKTKMQIPVAINVTEKNLSRERE